MEEEKSQLTVLTPSILSFFGALAVSLLLVINIVWSVGFENRTIQGLLLGESYSGFADEFTYEVESVNDRLADSPLDAVPVAIVWMLIGMFVFTLLNGIISSYNSIQALKRELDHDKQSRDKILRIELTYVVARTVSLVVWLAYFILYFKLLVPYWYEITKLTALNVGTLDAALYGLWAIVIMWLSLHVHVVFARLVALRRRLFQ